MLHAQPHACPLLPEDVPGKPTRCEDSGLPPIFPCSVAFYIIFTLCGRGASGIIGRILLTEMHRRAPILWFRLPLLICATRRGDHDLHPLCFPFHFAQRSIDRHTRMSSSPTWRDRVAMLSSACLTSAWTSGGSCPIACRMKTSSRMLSMRHRFTTFAAPSANPSGRKR